MRIFLLRHLVLGFSFLACIGCASVETVHVDIDASPKEDPKQASVLEKTLGENGYYYLLLNYKLVDDVPQIHRLQKLGTRLTHYSERPEIEYKYLIIDSKYHTAFSFPDGYIVFSTAMLNSLASDEKILCVLAHEIAHITHRHGVYFYEAKFGLNKSEVTGERAFSLATQLGYNRAFELQADQTALRYLYRAGLDPQTFIDSLRQLEHFEKEDESLYQDDVKAGILKENRKNDLLERLSYPHLQNRIVYCQNILPEIKQTEKVLYNPNDFQF